MKPLHLPNPFGCAVGFAAAGCGVGSLVGTGSESWLYPTLIMGHGTEREQMLAMYGGTFLGMKVGLVVGALAGVLYALLVRRSRLRRQAPVT